MTNALKPIVGASFNEQAAYLVKDAMELIEGVLIKHSASVLEEMRDQIVSRNKRIAELEAECERLRNIERQLTDLNQTQFLELEWLRPIANAAKDLSDNAEEYDFADGLGQGAIQQYWEALDTALEPATDAIDAAIKESER